MGHTYTNLVYHVVFSTKERRSMINSDLAPRLPKYVGGLLRQRGGALVAMDGTDNHVHLLALLSPVAAVADVVRDVKSLTSGWIHDSWPNLRAFTWQGGYAAFSVGREDLPRVKRYIDAQPEHHRKISFEEELVGMLKRAGVDYDPRYVFE